MTHIPTLTPESLTLIESATPSLVPGMGQLYVSEVDGSLRYMDADGYEIVVNVAYGGEGTDGDLVVSTPIQLARESHFRRLTLVAGGSIDLFGFILSAQILDLVDAQENALHDNGQNGNDAVGTTGAGLLAAATRRLIRQQLGRSRTPTVAGNGGVTNGGNGGGQGNIGILYGGRTTITTSGTPISGGNGSAGTGGGSGTTTANTYYPALSDNPEGHQGGWLSATVHTNAANVSIPSGGMGGNGGGGGAGNGTDAGGGGGGGGEGGGVIKIDVGVLITGASTPASVISARGGRGGHGATIAIDGVGGGGGGGGGAGGAIRFRCALRQGPVVVNGLDASGGQGGDGGLGGGGAGIGGRGGRGGGNGQIRATIAGVTTTSIDAGTGSGANGTAPDGGLPTLAQVDL